MIFKLNKEILKKALLLELEEEMEAIPDEYYSPHIFSKKVERKIKILQKRAARPKRLDVAIQVTKKAAMILLAISLASFVTIMSVEALREKFFKFVEQKFKEYSIVFYEPTQTHSSNLSSKEFIARVPGYIPTGFDLVNDYRIGKVRMYFTNNAGDYIRYQQTWIDDAEMRINTEGIELEPCDFDGKDANYYMNLNNHTLIWDDGKYDYFIASNLSKDTVFRIARSINIEK